MTDELSPMAAKMVEIVVAVQRGDASGYPELDVLTAIGAVFVSRHWVAEDPAKVQVLDQALELLVAEIEARGVLADSPLSDLIDPGNPDDPRRAP
jgi:hypothetical protein